MCAVRHTILRIIAVLTLLAPCVLAEADPPGRVARLSYMKGEVSLQPAGADDWNEAALNRPLTSSDRLWTGNDARAELSIGTAALRLGSSTSFSFLNLSDRTTQVQLVQGTLNIRLRQLDERENFEIDTPNAAVTLLRTGDYRIDVRTEGDSTTVTVRSGYAQVDASGQAVAVRSHQLARLYGEEPSEGIVEAPARDEFDSWCMERNERMDRAVSARYVSPAVIGYEELDEYGTWASTPEYGMVWVPRVVSAGWAPYRFGRWTWIGPWGWTWIDAAPWGFAPFHYGRWVYRTAGWAWIPGPIIARPIYAPALVAFVGGNHWGAGLSFGDRPIHGWIPLGPRERYLPRYRASNTYITNINITNITNVHGSFRSPRRLGYINEQRGRTVVSDDVFRRGQPIQDARIRFPERVLRHPVVVHIPPAAPEAGNGFRTGERAPLIPPTGILVRPVQTRIAPPAGIDRRPPAQAGTIPARPTFPAWRRTADRPVIESRQQFPRRWGDDRPNTVPASGFARREQTRHETGGPAVRPGNGPNPNVRALAAPRPVVHIDRAPAARMALPPRQPRAQESRAPMR